MKKRDYDGAIAAFTTAHEIATPKMSASSMCAALPTATRATTSVRWPITICACSCVRTYGRAYNNRGMIFMRRGELERAFEEFNLAIKHIANDQNRYTASL